MADNQYKIELGVKINANDIQRQINKSVGNTQLKKINLELNTKRIQSQLNSVRKQIQNLSKIRVSLNLGSGSGLNNGGRGITNNNNWAYKQMLDIQKKANSLSLKMHTLDTSKNVNELKELSSQLKILKADYEILKKTFGNQLSTTQFGNLQAEIDETDAKLKVLDAKIADTKAKVSKEIRLKLETGDFANQVRKVESDSEKLSKSSNDVEVGIKELNQALTNMKTAAAKGDMEGLISANEKYEAVLKKVQNQIQINARAQKDAAVNQKLVDDRAAFQSKIDAWLTKNSAGAKKFGNRLLELKAQAQSCDRVTLNHLESELRQIDKEAEAAGLKMQTFGDRLKAQFSKYKDYLSVATMIMYATQGLRDMFEQVKLIDSAMTELKKVTNETDASYDKFLTNAATRAREIGTTIDGLVSSTADFARLGYGFEDAQGLAEVANIYAVVGDEIEGVEGATESLISTLAAFKDEASGISDSDFAMDIVDKFNEVSNNFAISSGGIGEAMQRSASSLRAANNTIDESIALITAANEVTQDPAVVGNAFKTMSMRIRGAKTELEEAGLETDGMVESTAKLREEILALSGVDIMLDNNTFKSTYQILDELAVKWKDLTDIQQASVTELIAGKRQGNVVSSLMNNFQTARDALETSLNSSGSAMAEHAKWQQSLEAQINKLKASWQGLSQAFLKSDFLKTALNAVIGLVDGLTSLIDTIGTIPTLALAFTAFKSLNGKGIFKVIKDEATGAAVGITNVFKESASESVKALQSIGLKGSSAFKDGLKSDIAAFGQYRKAIREGMSETDAHSKYLEKASVAFQEYKKSGKLATEGVSGFIKQQKLSQVSIQAQNKSLGNANAIIKEYFSGCKNVGVGQKDFADAVSKTNPQLGTQLKSAKSAKGALVGYGKSLAGATIKTFALEAATMALNAALTMGISALISFAVKAIDELIETDEELAEKVEEVTSKFKEQHNELAKLKGDYDTSNESSMISKYEKLSKGVDSLGRNVSLTADEYSEYQSIVNKIADQFPSLITGYDEQGNALLSCKGNVEQLTEAYEKLIEAQNSEVLNSAGDIEKNFKNAVEDLNSAGWNGSKMNTTTIKGLEELYSNPQSKNVYKNFVNNADVWDSNASLWDNIISSMNVQYKNWQVASALESAGVDMPWWSYLSFFGNNEVEKKLEETMGKDPEIIKNIIKEHYGNLDEYVEEMKTIGQATLSNAFDIRSSEYYGMSDTLKNVANQIINSFDDDFFIDLQSKGITVRDYTNEMLESLNALSKSDVNNIETAFDLQTQFNGGEIPYGEYVDGLRNTGKLIDGLDLDEEIKSQLKLNLGLNEKGLVEEYEALANRLTGEIAWSQISTSNAQNAARTWLNGLSEEELSVAVDLIAEMSDDGVKHTIDDFQAALEREMAIRGLTLELNIEVEKTKIEALTSAITESFSGSGLSSDSISAVEGMFSGLSSYDPSKLFERTANGIHINSSELRKLNNEYSKTNVAKINKQMDSLGDIYNQTREELYNLTYGTDEYNDKAKDLSNIEAQIKSLEQLSAQYEGLASAYQQWQMAESTGSERGMYEGMLEGFENVGDEISRGWIDDGTREFLELLKGEKATIIDGEGNAKEINIATASAKELKRVWKDLDKTIEHTSYSVRDFFTVDEDGNSTSQGVYNFLDAIGQMEEEEFAGKDVVKRDKKGNIIGFDFQMVGGDKVIAEALGVSEELVQIMKRASADAGFVVTLDGSFQQLDVLKEKAQKAAESMNKILKGDNKATIDIDMNADTIEEIQPQLDKIMKTFGKKDGNGKLTGEIDMSINGAEEAIQVASTLQSMLDKLTRPAYMNIEVSQVEDELREPLRNLQDYRTKIEQLNQAKLRGADTTELESSIEESKDKVVADLIEIQKNNPKLAGELEIKGLTKEEIEKKVEAGEITIPATIDIQLEMDEKLGILVDKALLDAGIIDKEEFTKRVNVYLDAEVDSDDAKDKTDKAVGAVTGTTKGAETAVRKTNIEIVAETFGIEDVDDLSSKLKDLDDKTIQSFVEVIGQADVKELQNIINNLGAEDKVVLDIIAKAMGKGDVEGLKDAVDKLSPKTVEAIAKALGYDKVEELKTAIANMDGKTVQAIAQALGINDVDSLIQTINNLTSKTVFAKAIASGQSKVQSLIDTIKKLKDKTVNVITNFVEKVASAGKKKAAQRTGEDPDGSTVNGTANVNGTTFVNGTSGKAFKQGNWGTKNSGTALVGELGREVLVRDGRYYTIGDNGAEFIKYKKGDIIFNHVQSEQLFRNGKVTAGGGRAKALANGTAFVGGSYPSSGAAFNLLDGYGEWIAPEVKSFTVGYDYSSNKDSNSDNSDKEKTQEIFDWVEVAIDRIEREIDNLDRTANSTYKSWSERNAALADQINMVGNEIALQEQAIKVYQQALSEISLDQKYIDAIKNGSLSIDNIDDEVTADKISDYQKWYEKILDCTDKIEELKQSEAELYMQRIENAAAQYEGILNVIEHKGSMIEEYMSQAEAQGWLISANYYEGLISNAQQSISQLEQQKAAMLAELGNIAVGTEDWYKAVNMIDEVTLSIEQNRTAILEWQQAIQQADWEVFDLLQEQMADVADEAQFFIELLSNKKLYDDNGKMTNEGMATMGQHGVAYNVYMHQADEYAREAEKIKAEMANDPYDTELEKRYRELISLQREHILEAENEKNAIRDMVEEGISLELDVLQERIDLYNENLQSAKDLYEYQKKVKEQTEEIASLEKQMSAYQGDDSEEAKAKIQELKVSLEDARENLEETEYEKYISDQQKLLDNLFLEYETVLNTRLDDIDGLMTEMIAEINANAGTISSTLHEAASDVGYTLSNSMETIWSGTNNVIQMYGQQFSSNQTSTNTALNNLRTRLDAIVAAMNAKALADVQKANTSSVADTKAPAGTKPTTTTPTTPTVKPASTADGVPRVGDAVKFERGKYYYDSQGQNPSGSQMLGQTVYIGIINERSWATHKYALYRDKEFKHGLGWVSLDQISGYAQGAKYIDDSGLAWTQEKGQEYIVRPSDGAILTPVAKGDSVLSAQASGNIWDMANNPSDFIKDNLNLGVTSTPNNSSVQNSYVQNLDKVVFNFPNVKNYDEMLSSLRDDPNFERLLLSMTINQLAGKSSLAKGKSIR